LLITGYDDIIGYSAFFNGRRQVAAPTGINNKKGMFIVYEHPFE